VEKEENTNPGLTREKKEIPKPLKKKKKGKKKNRGSRLQGARGKKKEEEASPIG